MNNQKMIKAANVLDRIAKIVEGFAGAMIWVFLIFALLVAVVGQKVFTPDYMTLELGFISVELSQDYQAAAPMFRTYTAAILAIGAVYAAALRYLSRLIRAILAPMKAGRPFENSVCVSLRKIAYWVFAVGGISQAAQLATTALTVRAYPIEAVFSGDAVRSMKVLYTFDTGFLLAGFMILFLSWVFAYGQTLQREADETL